jgi:hypothetical protein
VDGTGSGSCPVASFCISDVDLLTSLVELCLTEVMCPICMHSSYLSAGSSCCCMKAHKESRIISLSRHPLSTPIRKSFVRTQFLMSVATLIFLTA